MCLGIFGPFDNFDIFSSRNSERNLTLTYVSLFCLNMTQLDFSARFNHQHCYVPYLIPGMTSW